MTQYSKAEVLARLNLGSSVAENDENLESYFVPTEALEEFLADRYDVVRGAKGSGKSAILRMVSRPTHEYSQLRDVVTVVATEHTGEPAFKRAFEPMILDEVSDAALTSAWKTYILNLALDAIESLPDSNEKSAAIQAAEACALRYRTPNSFKKIWWSLLRILHVKSFGVGVDSVTAEFPDAPPDFWTKNDRPVDFPEILHLVVAALERSGRRCWVLMDRLDAAFQDKPELERRALRSLLVAYKDFMGRRALRVKLFMRTDLYDIVTHGSGFRELTHIADRASQQISWEPDKLLQLLMERFAFNNAVCARYGFSKEDVAVPDYRSLAFFSLFPAQIDIGKRKSDSWTWISNRIRDGNGVRTPRDLLGLVVNAAVNERQQLNLGRGVDDSNLISATAVKAGLEALSLDKVGTTLLAENPDLETAIRAFRRQKAEQNLETLSSLLGPNADNIVDRLVKIGFLEKLPESWRVPMLYRDGLGIVQGAAFPKREADEE